MQFCSVFQFLSVFTLPIIHVVSHNVEWEQVVLKVKQQMQFYFSVEKMQYREKLEVCSLRVPKNILGVWSITINGSKSN